MLTPAPTRLMFRVIMLNIQRFAANAYPIITERPDKKVNENFTKNNLK